MAIVGHPATAADTNFTTGSSTCSQMSRIYSTRRRYLTLSVGEKVDDLVLFEAGLGRAGSGSDCF